MKRNVFVSVSTDPIKEYQKITDYVSLIQDKADLLHCDIMDGKFVDGKTYDARLLENINHNSVIMLDVHLMIENPQNYYQDYINAGANIITVHYEAFKDKELLDQVIKDIKSQGILAGISIKPGTSFKEIKNFLYGVDIVLVMSVEPGASGQKFMPSALEKIKEIDKFRSDNNLAFKIEVDGGVNEGNSHALIAAGVDILVSGSYVYNSKDKAKAIETLKSN